MTNAIFPLAPVQRIYTALDRVPFSVLIMVARVATFSVFMRSGLSKLSDWSATLALFHDEYKVPLIPPDIAAYMAAGMELTLSTLVLVGLFSRLSVLGLFGMIVVIQIFVYPTAWPDHIQWIGFIIFILCRGPGAFSLDALIGRVIAGRAAPAMVA